MNGWVTPLAESAGTCWVSASLEHSIRQNIRAAVLTRKGERRLAPQFGSRIHDFFFRILDSALIAELESHLMAVLAQCEPRISVKEIQLNHGRCESNEIQLFLRYQILPSNCAAELRMVVKP